MKNLDILIDHLAQWHDCRCVVDPLDGTEPGFCLLDGLEHSFVTRHIGFKCADILVTVGSFQQAFFIDVDGSDRITLGSKFTGGQLPHTTASTRNKNRLFLVSHA